jgi:hypothetical protein
MTDDPGGRATRIIGVSLPTPVNLRTILNVAPERNPLMQRRTLRTTVVNITANMTVAVLAALGVLHVLWGRGSTVPFRSRHELNDHVIGQQVTPSPAACYAVAGLLATAAVGVDRSARTGLGLARVAAAGCSIVLASRAALGFSGRTDLAVPGSTSETFRRNDRRVFAPLCAALALGSALAASRPANS